jgi:hypothetical protein
MANILKKGGFLLYITPVVSITPLLAQVSEQKPGWFPAGNCLPLQINHDWMSLWENQAPNMVSCKKLGVPLRLRPLFRHENATLEWKA